MLGVLFDIFKKLLQAFSNYLLFRAGQNAARNEHHTENQKHLAARAAVAVRLAALPAADVFKRLRNRWQRDRQ